MSHFNLRIGIAKVEKEVSLFLSEPLVGGSPLTLEPTGSPLTLEACIWPKGRVLLLAEKSRIRNLSWWIWPCRHGHNANLHEVWNENIVSLWGQIPWGPSGSAISAYTELNQKNDNNNRGSNGSHVPALFLFWAVGDALVLSSSTASSHVGSEGAKSRDRRHYWNPAQKKGDNNSGKGSEDEMLVYVNHLLLGRCLSLLSPIPVLVLRNLLCTNEDIKGQRGYLRT